MKQVVYDVPPRRRIWRYCWSIRCAFAVLRNYRDLAFQDGHVLLYGERKLLYNCKRSGGGYSCSKLSARWKRRQDGKAQCLWLNKNGKYCIKYVDVPPTYKSEFSKHISFFS